jgi:ribosomal protein L37AE/L43A
MVFPINCPYCGETAKRSAAGYYCPACGAKERPVQYVTTTNSTAAPPLVMRVPKPKKGGA